MKSVCKQLQKSARVENNPPLQGRSFPSRQQSGLNQRDRPRAAPIRELTEEPVARQYMPRPPTDFTQDTSPADYLGPEQRRQELYSLNSVVSSPEVQNFHKSSRTYSNKSSMNYQYNNDIKNVSRHRLPSPEGSSAREREQKLRNISSEHAAASVPVQPTGPANCSENNEYSLDSSFLL